MTPHIEAKKEDISKIVIMPGDPKRAELIAKSYLDDYRMVSEVRGMKTYTGTYKGTNITVMPSGMGCPSMGIYSYELFKFYEVEKIIKVGTCGSYIDNFNMGDLLLVDKSFSESTYALVQDNISMNLVDSSSDLNSIIKSTAKELGQDIFSGVIHCSDVFYEEDSDYKNKLYEKYGCIACEMESFALLHNAKKFGRDATEILTVTDNLVTGERLSSDDRQNRVGDMIVLALESAIRL